MNKQLIRFRALSQKLGGVSRSTIDRWEKAQNFPGRVKIGKNSVAWDLQSVDHWFKGRASNWGAK